MLGDCCHLSIGFSFVHLRNFILFPLAGISLSLANPCEPATRGPKQPGPSDVVYEVAVTTPKLHEMTFDTQGTGHFSASDQVVIKAQATALIEKVLVGEGDRVSPGDTLAQLAGSVLNAELTKKQAELKEAEAQLVHDQKNSELAGQIPYRPRTDGEPVFLDEDMPPPAPTNAGVANKTPEPNPAATDWQSKFALDQAHIDKIKKEIDEVEARIKDLNIVAPIGGLIKRRHVTDGALAGAGEPLFEIVNTDPMTVTFTVPQEVSAYVDKQLKVKASPKNAPEVSGEGPIFYISPGVDPVTHSIEIKAHVSNEKNLMKDGEEAFATLTTRKVKKVLLIPRKALVAAEGKQYLFFVNGRQTRRIEAYPLSEADEQGNILVDANLGVDDLVLIVGQERVKDGSFIKVVTTETPTPLPAPPVPTAAY